MASLAEENHPRHAPLLATDLRRFISRVSKEELMSQSKWQRDMRKEELRAQLFYYGIEYSDRTTLPTLDKLLRNAIETQKCDPSSPRIAEYERRLDKARRLKEEAWQRCTTPVERATEDLDRFMKHYFSDRTTTTEPLALYGFVDRSAIHSRAERIPGLETTSSGEGQERTVCIGWDRSAVWNLAGTISAKAWEAKAKEQETEWEEIMEEHRTYVGSLPKRKKNAAKMTDREKLEKCKGSYVVRSDEISSGWDNCDDLTLDIETGPQPGILQAAVEFGIIEGTMLLAFNETELDAYVEAADETDDSDDDGGYSDDDSEQTPAPSKKRKPATNSKAAKPTRGRPKKQAKTTTTSSTRLFFRLRGRETGEGEIFHNAQKGYLDFTNDQFVAFKGIASIPFIGSEVPFEGFKVNGEAESRVTPWETFSAAAYERERESRWH